MNSTNILTSLIITLFDEENLFKLLEDTEKVLGDDNATVFEILTCAFLKYAESFKNNINIVEAGLFHQFDSTNVFKKNLMRKGEVV